MSDQEAFVTVDGSHYRVRNGGDRLEANPIGSAGWYTLAFFDPGWEPGRGILLALLGKPSDEALMAELRRTEEFAKRDRAELRAEVDRLRVEIRNALVGHLDRTTERDRDAKLIANLSELLNRATTFTPPR